MTFDDLWKHLVEQQPRLANGSEQIVFSVKGFREILKQVYKEGVAQGVVSPSKGLRSLFDEVKLK